MQCQHARAMLWKIGRVLWQNYVCQIGRMESSACKIVGYVGYNGEVLVQLGVQVPSPLYSPHRNPEFRQSAVSSDVFVLFIAREILPNNLLLCRQQIYNQGLTGYIAFSVRLFSLPIQLRLDLQLTVLFFTICILFLCSKLSLALPSRQNSSLLFFFGPL